MRKTTPGPTTPAIGSGDIAEISVSPSAIAIIAGEFWAVLRNSASFKRRRFRIGVFRRICIPSWFPPLNIIAVGCLKITWAEVFRRAVYIGPCPQRPQVSMRIESMCGCGSAPKAFFFFPTEPSRSPALDEFHFALMGAGKSRRGRSWGGSSVRGSSATTIVGIPRLPYPRSYS